MEEELNRLLRALYVVAALQASILVAAIVNIGQVR